MEYFLTFYRKSPAEAKAWRQRARRSNQVRRFLSNLKPVQLEISLDSKVFALKSRVFALLGAKALDFGAKALDFFDFHVKT